MAKVTISGETFMFDMTYRPMSEALAIENGLKCTYAKWEDDLRAGSARAMCAFVWLVWKRAGRDVKLEDILSGEVDFNTTDLDVGPEEGDAAADPTGPPQEASSPTGAPTSASSRKSSASSPGKSRS